MFKLTVPKDVPPKTIDLGDMGSFNVLLRRPTWQEQLHDDGLVSAGFGSAESIARARSLQVDHRIRSIVTGWTDLIGIDDNPIPFTWENLTSLCARFPIILVELEQASNDLFNGLTEESAKNSDGAPSVSSEVTPEQNPPSENSPSSPASENS
ncbi:MAG: hypothetical protein KGL39_17095 [Patescibacteria group bacterium]|nr:hypothetical protein [Patescibacteria group bacterium]